ncbi:MAG: hypothetical protein WAL22_17145 [Solirubrobacteraceae bacterium]
MIIAVDMSQRPGSVALLAPDDFGGFHVEVPGAAVDTELAGVVSTFGRLTDDGTHVFVEVGAIRDLAGDRADDVRWQASFDGMLAYADAHGWRDADGRVRAHVQRSD